MSGRRLSESALRVYLDEAKTLWEIMEATGLSRNTVRNAMTAYGIPTPPGFFSRGLPIGRPPGFTPSSEIRAHMAKRMKGERNPFYGRQHDEATRRKMSENHADVRGDRNPFRRSLEDPERRSAHVHRCRAAWAARDDTYRRRFGEAASRRMTAHPVCLDPRFYRFHDSGWIDTQKAGRVFHRSSWERHVYEALDRDPRVTTFAVEAHTIPYRDSADRQRHTRVDVVVHFLKMPPALIEIKPQAMHRFGTNPQKLEAIQRFCQQQGWRFGIVDHHPVKEPERLDALIESLSGERR